MTILEAEGWKLEVLSTGKQVVVPPSIHPSGQAYRWLTPLTTIPLLLRAIHAAVEEALSAAMQTAITTGRLVQGLPAGTGTRPGDDFNRRADWASILQPHGWVPVRQRGEVIYWRRPGKGEGISATTHYAGSGLLYIFSTNAAPFEADTGYAPFAAYAMLEHGGNYTAAARTLRGQGYGSQSPSTDTSYQRRTAARVAHYKRQLYADPYFGTPERRAKGIPVAILMYQETPHD